MLTLFLVLLLALLTGIPVYWLARHGYIPFVASPKVVYRDMFTGEDLEEERKHTEW